MRLVLIIRESSQMYLSPQLKSHIITFVLFVLLLFGFLLWWTGGIRLVTSFLFE